MACCSVDSVSRGKGRLLGEHGRGQNYGTDRENLSISGIYEFIIR
jgi:hypothetical protein